MGDPVGEEVGEEVGALVGALVGSLVGCLVGCLVGDGVGNLVGSLVGCLLGDPVGFLVGLLVGFLVGDKVVGLLVGSLVGSLVGVLVGNAVGFGVGLGGDVLVLVVHLLLSQLPDEHSLLSVHASPKAKLEPASQVRPVQLSLAHSLPSEHSAPCFAPPHLPSVVPLRGMQLRLWHASSTVQEAATTKPTHTFGDWLESQSPEAHSKLSVQMSPGCRFPCSQNLLMHTVLRKSEHLPSAQASPLHPAHTLVLAQKLDSHSLSTSQRAPQAAKAQDVVHCRVEASQHSPAWH